MHFSILSDLKKTTEVVESLSTTSTRCSVTEITSLLQDSNNRMRNLHQEKGHSQEIIVVAEIEVQVTVDQDQDLELVKQR